tara:strand:- start:307 stop:561 length:255 start_codon:yes stop_codon:yes gene_type:complete
MTEFFLPFLIGYGVARILSFMLSANKETAVNRNNILLKWDNDTFAWRPCPLSMVDDSTTKYMVAAPIDYETVKLLKCSSEPSDG